MSTQATEPIPAPPAINMQAFQSVLWPQDVSRVLNLLVGGSPFAASLSRYPTQRNSVAFPTARPDRPNWLPELSPIPVVGLDPDAEIVAVCKLASVILLSNESVSDSQVSLVGELSSLLQDSASAELDRGCLYGADEPEPKGVVAEAPPAEGADLAGALTAAIGSIGDSGGVVTHIAARPSALASARNLRDSNGQMLYPGGFGAAFGLQEIPAPEMQPGDALAFDASRCWLVVRDDFAVDVSTDAAFTHDAVAVRVRGRFAVAVPALDKGIRRLVVGTSDGGAAPSEPAEPTPTRGTRSRSSS